MVLKRRKIEWSSVIIVRWPALVGLAAALAALAAAIVYAQHGLSLSHYDGRAHLVVARRIADSLTPGWHQIGAVWLPLPHLLNFVPVQWDWAYRTGATAIAISIASMGVSAFACARLLLRATGSYLAGAVAAALLVTNVNLLYLHATPMTEPLLLALAFLSIERLDAWLRDPRLSPAAPGVPLFLLCLTRYEGWTMTAAAMAMAFLVIGANEGLREGTRRWMRVAVWPAAAGIGFLFLSRATVGAWFVSSGFFIPDNPAKGNAGLVLEQIRDGLERLSSPAFAAFGAFGFVVVAARGLGARHQRSLLVVLALAAMAALPFLAFHAGHPFRIRYMTPLVAASALFTGFAVGFAPSIARIAVIAAAAILIVPDLRPYDHTSPMIAEARREERHQRARAAVTATLQAHWDGTPILMSMGSLAHYMHDLSRSGFDIADFVHEGNGEIWSAAIVDPAGHAEFLIVEERAEGGDVFAHLLRDHPEIAARYARIAAGGNVALYRRR
jgi:hypothetical protein